MMTKDKIEFEGKMYDAVELTWYDENERSEKCMVFAEDWLYDDLFVDRESDEIKSPEAERLFEYVEYFTRDAHKADTEVDFINALCEENSDYLEVFNSDVLRRCDVCGKVMDTGYMNDEGWFHACSEECLKESYKDTGDAEQMQKDLDDDVVFYTEWDEGPFYAV